MKRRRGKPPTYVATLDPSKENDAGVLEGVQRAVRQVNKMAGVRMRVHTSPRWDKKGPHAWKYDNRFSRGKRRRREDAASVDVYIKEK